VSLETPEESETISKTVWADGKLTCSSAAKSATTSEYSGHSGVGFMPWCFIGDARPANSDDLMVKDTWASPRVKPSMADANSFRSNCTLAGNTFPSPAGQGGAIGKFPTKRRTTGSHHKNSSSEARLFWLVFRILIGLVLAAPQGRASAPKPGFHPVRRER